MQNSVNYIVFGFIAAFFVRRWFLSRSVRKKLPQYLRDGALIVDVRSPAEFDSGHAPGSINIPLQQLAGKAAKLDAAKTILLCCASGSRSGMAAAILKGKGFKNVVNAGSWYNLAEQGKI